MPDIPDDATQLTVTELLRQQHQQVRQLFAEFEQLPADQRGEAFDCLRRLLAVHETAEEMVIHSAARELGDEANAVVEARIAEEDQAKRDLADLEKLGPDGEHFGVDLLTFRRAVEAHAEAEERDLFPLVEAGYDTERLWELADSIRIAEDMAPTHPHPHGPNSALGNLLVGPFVGMVDKVRDRLKQH